MAGQSRITTLSATIRLLAAIQQKQIGFDKIAQISMVLSAGTRLGPYEILSRLGAGGMGEVYRARDSRMGREIAIKLSAEKFTDRFEREVHAVAALNHPNICQIYDVGPNYLVMELVEGPTLAGRIQQGAIPLDEALSVARQIADALEAAHEKGIIHRDLKPANIKIKPDGVVKVLDFGLAKIAEPAAATDNPEDSPTLTIEATRIGQVLGTAAYMAPEQARGQKVDKRADIWAFGVVLYEMLTGRKLFEGKTISDVLAEVLTKDPDWQRAPAKTQRLLRRCLEKDPKRRLRDIGDAGPLLDDLPIHANARSAAPWKIATGVFALVATLLGVVLWRFPPPVEQPAIRLDLDLGPDVSLAETQAPAVILSPDGTRLVFVSQDSKGTSLLFVRRLDQPKAIRLSGTEGAYGPFFSPDGQWVGFFAQGKLKKTRIDGGEPISLCDAPQGRGASWGEDGSIIAALDTLVGLSLIRPEGGKPVPLTTLSRGEVTHRWPLFLPGGKALLFSARGGRTFDEADIVAFSLKDHRRETVIQHAGMYPRYLPNGYLIYVTKGNLMGVPFDVEHLAIRGPTTLLEQLSSSPRVGAAQLDFSRNGTLAYRMGEAEGLTTIQWLDSAGNAESLVSEPARYQYFRLSPHGSQLAYTVDTGAGTDLWIYDWQRGTKTRLTNGITAWGPVWSPDGQFVVFNSAGRILWTRADGGDRPHPLTDGRTLEESPTSFSPDGKQLVVSKLVPEQGPCIRTLPLEIVSGQLRAGEPQLFTKTSTLDNFASFSPDGRWLAYADADAGRYEVYVRAVLDKGIRVQVSNAGGMMPVWSSNGRELFYRTEDNRLMVANYSVKGDAFVAAKPQIWCERQLASTGLRVNFDLAPDGKRFAVLMPVEGAGLRVRQSHVTLVLNFFDEVRRHVAREAK
jgi:serine/threonine-protein kinase